MAIKIINYLKDNNIEDVAVFQNEFYGYSSEKPTIELVIPKMGQVIFGKVEPEEAVNLVEKYMVNTQEIAHFLVDNHGDRKKKH